MHIASVSFSTAMAKACMTCAKCGRLSPNFPCSCGSVDFAKTQTRRPISPQPFLVDGGNAYDDMALLIPPRFVPGDILWMRESGVCMGQDGDQLTIRYVLDGSEALVSAPRLFEKWRGKYPLGAPDWVIKRQRVPNGIIKEAARVWFEVMAERAEHIQDITLPDILAEGIKKQWSDDCPPERYRFRDLWDSLNAKRKRGWIENPWVRVYTFKRIAKPENVSL